MSRNVFVLTKCDGSPQRVIASKEWADSILEDDVEACGVPDHQHQIVELELEYDKSEAKLSRDQHDRLHNLNELYEEKLAETPLSNGFALRETLIEFLNDEDIYQEDTRVMIEFLGQL